jgi:hypothetical protein
MTSIRDLARAALDHALQADTVGEGLNADEMRSALAALDAEPEVMETTAEEREWAFHHIRLAEIRQSERLLDPCDLADRMRRDLDRLLLEREGVAEKATEEQTENIGLQLEYNIAAIISGLTFASWHPSKLDQVRELLLNASAILRGYPHPKIAAAVAAENEAIAAWHDVQAQHWMRLSNLPGDNEGTRHCRIRAHEHEVSASTIRARRKAPPSSGEKGT